MAALKEYLTLYVTVCMADGYFQGTIIFHKLVYSIVNTLLLYHLILDL